MNPTLDAVIQTIVKACSNIVFAVILFFVGKWAIKKITKLLDGGKLIGKLEVTAKNYILSTVKIGLYVLLGISIINMLGVPMASIITVLASCGLAVGMALQGALQNLAGGIMLMAFHPFKRGDFIDAAGVSGTVKEISLFYTLLCTADNKHITVPNGSLMNANVVNYSAEKYRRVDMVFSYDWDEDPVKIQNLLMSVLEKHPMVIKEEGKLPFARLSGGTDQSLAFTVRAWTLQENYWTVFYDLNQQITEIMSENNIKAPSYRVIESK